MRYSMTDEELKYDFSQFTGARLSVESLLNGFERQEEEVSVHQIFQLVRIRQDNFSVLNIY
jgi:hypothetical protein